MADDEEIVEIDSAAEEATLRNAQQERARALLSCIRSKADLDRLDDTGISEDCFKSFDNYAEVYKYLVETVGREATVSRTDVRNKFSVELLTGVSDIRLYAAQVVSE